jgi:hypothetical protein
MIQKVEAIILMSSYIIPTPYLKIPITIEVAIRYAFRFEQLCIWSNLPGGLLDWVDTSVVLLLR